MEPEKPADDAPSKRSTLINLPRHAQNTVSSIIVRTCTHQPDLKKNHESSTWNPVYHFESIKLFAGLSKLKIYQAAFTAAGVPILMWLEMSQIVPTQTAELFGVLGITGTVSLSIFSLFSTKIIGFVYVNPVLNQVRLSYIDFWGSRKNQDLTLDDIISTDEKRMLNTYSIIKTRSTAGSLKLLRFGKIMDYIRRRVNLVVVKKYFN